LWWHVKLSKDRQTHAGSKRGKVNVGTIQWGGIRVEREAWSGRGQTDVGLQTEDGQSVTVLVPFSKQEGEARDKGRQTVEANTWAF